jgi:tetratricopeptide (TPR) repeat protein
VLTAALCSLAVCAVAVALGLPLARKPLAEDEGRWYYFAFFAGRGLRMHGNYHCQGYFNIPLLAAFFYRWAGRLAGRFAVADSPEVFQYFKIGWYALCAASVSWLALALFGQPWVALAAGLLYAVVQAAPKAMFMLTYAEHFAVLPANGAVVALTAVLRGADPALAAVAGALAGLCVHFKPTGLLLAGALGALTLAGPAPWAGAGWYAAGLAGMLALPLALIPRTGLGARPYLLTTLLEPLRDGLLALAALTGLGRLPGLARLAPGGYVGRLHAATAMSGWQKFRANMLPALDDLRAVPALAVAGLALAGPGAWAQAWLLAGLAALALAAQQLQKNYYTPHFNAVWAPLAVLAALGGWRLAELGREWPVAGALLGAAALWEAVRLGRRLAPAFSRAAALSFGIVHPYVGVLFATARDIGRCIGARAGRGDRLCVWGDQPTIYLYSGCMAFDPQYLFLYSHHADVSEEVWVLWSLREAPPRWFQFFTWKYRDGRDMDYIQDRVGVRYVPECTFSPRDASGAPVRNTEGGVDSFPLYRRDDAHYVKILAERAAAHEALGQWAEARRCYETADGVRPGDEEASLGLAILDAVVRDAMDREAGAAPEAPLAAWARAARRVAAPVLRADVDGPRGRAAALALARAHEAAGRAEAQAALLEGLTAREPEHDRALAALGLLRLGQGNARQALTLLHRAAQADPLSPGALAALGRGLAAVNPADAALARKCFEKALRLMWWHPGAAAGLDALTGGPLARMDVYEALDVFGYVRREDLPEALRPAGEARS